MTLSQIKIGAAGGQAFPNARRVAGSARRADLLADDVAPNYSWAVMAAVCETEPSVERSAAATELRRSRLGSSSRVAECGRVGVVQKGLRTPTGPLSENCFIIGVPWFGMRVAIHEAVDKADGVVFRCTLSGSAVKRHPELPPLRHEELPPPSGS